VSLFVLLNKGGGGHSARRHMLNCFKQTHKQTGIWSSRRPNPPSRFVAAGLNKHNLTQIILTQKNATEVLYLITSLHPLPVPHFVTSMSIAHSFSPACFTNLFHHWLLLSFHGCLQARPILITGLFVSLALYI